MRTSVLAVVLAVGAALVAGGTLRHLPGGRPRRWALAPLAVVALAASPALPGAGPAPVLVALVLLVVFAASNLHLVGMAVVLAGLALNLVVILANGAMPVDSDAVVAAGLVRSEELTLVDLGDSRRWSKPGDRLASLGDIVPVAPLDEVVSFGDLILAAGLANVTFRLLRPRPDGPGHPFGRRRAPRRRRGPVLPAPLSAG